MTQQNWSRALLLLTSAAYVIVLIAFPPVDDPTVIVLALVPLIIAASRFGLKVALMATIGLLLVTGVIVELLGSGVGPILETYRGVPLLMFILTGIVVGRLRDVRTTLEDELEDRRKAEIELLDTQRQLQELLNAKDELIASVSHELRTPLTAVLGFAQMLQSGNETGMAADERQEMVGFIAREAFELSGIIDDLLVAARLEIGKLEIASVPTTLRANVAQVIEGWDPGVISGVTVSGGDIKALGDPARVRQILRNLISNAIRYGGDDIEVRIGSDDKATFVDVRDNGSGLPVHQWETIFEPYERGHSEVSQPGSVGLGLTVSRGLAELMSGTLTYRYEDRHSIFTLRLPPAP